jgi:hypothetical protein
VNAAEGVTGRRDGYLLAMTPTIKACLTLLPRCAVQTDGSILLVLPMPPQALSPNACRGQSPWAAMAKAKLVKRHREIAKLIMTSALASMERSPCFTGYSLAFFFRTSAFRDDDNADDDTTQYDTYLIFLCSGIISAMTGQDGHFLTPTRIAK